MRSSAIALCLFLAACSGRAPTFSLQGYYFVGASDEKTAQTENEKLMQAVSEIVLAIYEKQPAKLMQYVHAQEGAIIDAKAFVTQAQVGQALEDENSMLYRVLWDDAYWKKTSPEETIRSYRTLFSKAGEIRVGLFYYSPTECEARIDFKDRPPMGIMANLVLRKRGDRWYMMNFF
jgi:hypothetical protein